jgi:hypothetical protein
VLDRDARVARVVVREHVVVRRKDAAAADGRGDVLEHRGRNRDAVHRRGAAAELVERDDRPPTRAHRA